MLTWDDGLKLAALPVWLDSRRPRPYCFVSHAHSDHLGGSHGLALCTPATAALADHRLRDAAPQALATAYGETLAYDPDTRFTLLPAGHVLGSAMLRVDRPEGTLLYTGDYKLRAGRTCPPAELCEADVLVMESTYGRPAFRFPPAAEVAEQLVDRVAGALRAGRQPVVMGYSLGKAQEIVKLLGDAGVPVTQHGAVASISDVYRTFGVDLCATRRYRREDFHGKAQLPLEERGALVAPPKMARTGFGNDYDVPTFKVVLTGWSLLKGAEYRYGADLCLPISDHADFDELIETVERVNPKRVYAHHGFPDFVDQLRRRGWDAQRAQPEAQMSLFG